MRGWKNGDEKYTEDRKMGGKKLLLFLMCFWYKKRKEKKKMVFYITIIYKDHIVYNSFILDQEAGTTEQGQELVVIYIV